MVNVVDTYVRVAFCRLVVCVRVPKSLTSHPHSLISEREGECGGEREKE